MPDNVPQAVSLRDVIWQSRATHAAPLLLAPETAWIALHTSKEMWEISPIYRRQTKTKNRSLFGCGFFSELRGQDSNLRPPGYEPDELPLLYPATRH